mmetsp:Transcript_18511/g.50188  ORF Transcript_18511/g.50188 Transcript_18511/m.50188 type:complete len:320 (+) Transcript_18511:1699-2658(+)
MMAQPKVIDSNDTRTSMSASTSLHLRPCSTGGVEGGAEGRGASVSAKVWETSSGEVCLGFRPRLPKPSLPLIQPVWLADASPDVLALPKRPYMAKRWAPIIAGMTLDTPPPPPLAAAEPPAEPPTEAPTETATEVATVTPTETATAAEAVAAASVIRAAIASVAALLKLVKSATLSPLLVIRGGGVGGGGGDDGGCAGAQASGCLTATAGWDTLNAVAGSPRAAAREAVRAGDEAVMVCVSACDTVLVLPAAFAPAVGLADATVAMVVEAARATSSDPHTAVSDELGVVLGVLVALLSSVCCSCVSAVATPPEVTAAKC